VSPKKAPSPPGATKNPGEKLRPRGGKNRRGKGNPENWGQKPKGVKPKCTRVNGFKKREAPRGKKSKVTPCKKSPVTWVAPGKGFWCALGKVPENPGKVNGIGDPEGGPPIKSQINENGGKIREKIWGGGKQNGGCQKVP